MATHDCSESKIARHLRIRGAWRPQGGFADDIVWPAIYTWRVQYVGRPLGGAVKPDVDVLLDIPVVKTLTYAGAGWLAGQTGGSYGPWIDRLRVHRVRLKRRELRDGTKLPYVCMIYERGRPIDFQLLHEACLQPEKYDAERARIIIVNNHGEETVFHRFARLWPTVEVIEPTRPQAMIEALVYCRAYLEVQHTLEPTLWALIAHAHRVRVHAFPYLGWSEWFRNVRGFFPLEPLPEQDPGRRARRYVAPWRISDGVESTPGHKEVSA